MPILGYIATAVVAYLLGSIPTGFLVAKARGIDIRTVGSGNIGATNAFRILGKGQGLLVLFGDASKGWIAVQLAAPLLAQMFAGAPENYLRITAGVSAILGHNYTCWLGFKGGKGIATTAGVLLALVPWALLIILGVWILLILLTRYVSVASIAASFVLLAGAPSHTDTFDFKMVNGITPATFNLMVETGIDGERITRERAEAEESRRHAEAARADFPILLPEEN